MRPLLDLKEIKMKYYLKLLNGDLMEVASVQPFGPFKMRVLFLCGDRKTFGRDQIVELES